jgi:hypothetical protein
MMFAGSMNITTKFISLGQGFFIKTSGGGTLQFDNSSRAQGEQAFYRSDPGNDMLVLKAIVNHITAQTTISFNAEAYAQVDRLFSVLNITSNSADVSLVDTKCVCQNMGINTLLSVIGYETAPGYFEAGMDDTYSFAAAQLKTLNGYVLLSLENVSLHYMQNLRTNPRYSLECTHEDVKKVCIIGIINKT